MAIHEWPETERPRERLLSQGPEALSDAELLAIFLRTGIAGKSAVDLARELLHRFGGLRGLLTATRSEFCAARGLGAAKYALLQATLEMGRRHLRERLVRGGPITCPEEIRDFLTARLRDSRREVFAVLFLDNRHRVLQFEELFHGTIDGASVYPREVVRRALEVHAAAVILAHNHPSGIAEPSRADEELTVRIQAALDLVSIRTLDHVIIGDGIMVSLAERGVLA